MNLCALQTLPPQSDDRVDTALRPSTLQSVIGQDQIKQNLEILIAAARRRKEPLDHVLFTVHRGWGRPRLPMYSRMK